MTHYDTDGQIEPKTYDATYPASKYDASVISNGAKDEWSCNAQRRFGKVRSNAIRTWSVIAYPSSLSSIKKAISDLQKLRLRLRPKHARSLQDHAPELLT